MNIGIIGFCYLEVKIKNGRPALKARRGSFLKSRAQRGIATLWKCSGRGANSGSLNYISKFFVLIGVPRSARDQEQKAVFSALRRLRTARRRFWRSRSG